MHGDSVVVHDDSKSGTRVRSRPQLSPRQDENVRNYDVNYGDGGDGGDGIHHWFRILAMLVFIFDFKNYGDGVIHFYI